MGEQQQGDNDELNRNDTEGAEFAMIDIKQIMHQNTASTTMSSGSSQSSGPKIPRDLRIMIDISDQSAGCTLNTDINVKGLHEGKESKESNVIFQMENTAGNTVPTSPLLATPDQ